MNVDKLKPEQATIHADGGFPNSYLPVLIYRGISEPGDRASELETLFASNGWTQSWRNGIYDFHHFHSTAHEVLGIAKGWVKVRLGAAGGEDFRLAAGDVVVLPAGMAHCRLDASDDLLVVGAYAQGRDVDMQYGKPSDLDAVMANIAAVPLPEADPVTGQDGVLLRAWMQVR